ncbi:MAG: fasciclin domain-containing protein [Chloroflexaceae bacterium]
MKRLIGLPLVLLIGVLLVSACSAPRPPVVGDAAATPPADMPAEDATTMTEALPLVEGPVADEATPAAAGEPVPTTTPITLDGTPIPDIVSTVAPGDMTSPAAPPIEEPAPAETEGTPLSAEVEILPTDTATVAGTATVTATSGVAGATENTIMGLVTADGRFMTLVNALRASDLAATLQEAGPYTFFAPTDDAFAALPEGTVQQLLENPNLLGDILAYHVANEALTAEEIAGMDELLTLQRSMIWVSSEGDTLMLNDDVQIIEAGIETENGIIHVIDGVLLPPQVELPGNQSALR